MISVRGIWKVDHRIAPLMEIRRDPTILAGQLQLLNQSRKSGDWISGTPESGLKACTRRPLSAEIGNIGFAITVEVNAVKRIGERLGAPALLKRGQLAQVALPVLGRQVIPA